LQLFGNTFSFCLPFFSQQAKKACQTPHWERQNHPQSTNAGGLGGWVRVWRCAALSQQQRVGAGSNSAPGAAHSSQGWLETRVHAAVQGSELKTHLFVNPWRIRVKICASAMRFHLRKKNGLEKSFLGALFEKWISKNRALQQRNTKGDKSATAAQAAKNGAWNCAAQVLDVVVARAWWGPMAQQQRPTWATSQQQQRNATAPASKPQQQQDKTRPRHGAPAPCSSAQRIVPRSGQRSRAKRAD